jgi:hypothetical protein
VDGLTGECGGVCVERCSPRSTNSALVRFPQPSKWSCVSVLIQHVAHSTTSWREKMTKIRPEDLLVRFREEYGEEYASFLWVDFGPSPRLCPYCKAESFRKLWTGDSARKLADSVWGKWYMWCESCLRGIYCPPGTYAVPKGERYIEWGDKAALEQALPSGLHLVNPTAPATGGQKARKLQRSFQPRRQ